MIRRFMVYTPRSCSIIWLLFVLTPGNPSRSIRDLFNTWTPGWWQPNLLRNMIIFLQNTHKWHFITHQWGMECIKCELTHWGRETHICVGKLTIIASDNGLLPGRRQAIIWTNAGILLIGPLGTNFNEILIEIHTFSYKKMHLKMASAKWRPFCLGLNVLIIWSISCTCHHHTLCHFKSCCNNHIDFVIWGLFY